MTSRVQISAAKRLDRALARGEGEVFPYRYPATYVTSPTQARNPLAYILDNWRHQAEADFPPLPTVLTGGLASASPVRPFEVPGPDPQP